MLIDVERKIAHPIAALIAKGKPCRRITQGIYENGHWSFELEFRGTQNFDLDFPDLGDFSCYGVCDSSSQLVESLPKAVLEGPEKFVVSMVLLKKSEQPKEGGWRWHKWGPYIGHQKPQREYLADEPEIEEVWTYHVYKLEG